MELFGKRYFFFAGLIFLAFSGLSFYFSGIKIFVVFSVALLIFALILKKNGRSGQNLRTAVLLFLALAALGTANTGRLLLLNRVRVEKYTGVHEVRAYVLEVEYDYPYGGEYLVRAEKIDGEGTLMDLVFVTSSETELARGDIFECEMILLPLGEYEDYELLRNGDESSYPLCATVSSGAEINYLEREWRLRTFFFDLNADLSARLRVKLGPSAGPLASALLLGNRELLDASVLRDFRRAGVYHMLALSGMHVALLVGALELFLKRLGAGRKIRIAVCAALCLAYVALTGFLLSACRAMLMLFMLYLSFVVKRVNDPLTSLVAAVSLIVLISPASVLDVGLALSFLSTFGIICATMIRAKLDFFKPDPRRDSLVKRVIRRLAFAALSSLCVLVATLPVLASVFGEVSLATFFTNLFMGTLCEIFMILAIFVLLTNPFPMLCDMLANIARDVGGAMTESAALISDIRGVVFSLSYPFVEAISWCLLISSLILLAVRLPKKRICAIPCALALVLVCTSAACFELSRAESVTSEFIAGDELVLSSAGGVYICDASDGNADSLTSAVRLAKENCFTEIDGVVLCRYRSKHAVTLKALAAKYKIRRVLAPMPQNKKEGALMRTLVDNLSTYGVEVYIYENREAVSLLGGELVVSERGYSVGLASPGYALTYARGESRVTLIEPKFFTTYVSDSGQFDDYVAHSDVIIVGSDGGGIKENFELYGMLGEECEVYFADFDTFVLSDYADYLGKRKIYFDTRYKKIVLK